jgi:hypothetical protein
VPGTLTLNPATLNFYAAGTANSQSTTASQSGYSGPFSVSGMTCSTSVATIAQSGATFNVTPVAAGPTCTFTIAGGGGMTATLTVNVTTSSGTVNAKHASTANPNPPPGKPAK